MGWSSWPCFVGWTMRVGELRSRMEYRGRGWILVIKTLFQVIAERNQRLVRPKPRFRPDCQRLSCPITHEYISLAWFRIEILYLKIKAEGGRWRATVGKEDVTVVAKCEQTGQPPIWTAKRVVLVLTTDPAKCPSTPLPLSLIHRHVQLSTRTSREPGSQGISQVRSRCCGKSASSPPSKPLNQAAVKTHSTIQRKDLRSFRGVHNFSSRYL